MDEELRIALSKKEKLELFLSNLEKLKEEGSLEEAQYQDLKTEYSAILEEVKSSIKSVKAKLRKEFDKKAEELEAAQREHELLQIRYNVREIRAEVYWAQVKPLRKKIEQLRKEVPKLQMLVNAKFTDEIGGPAKVNIPELKLKKPPLQVKKQEKSAVKPQPAEHIEVAPAEKVTPDAESPRQQLPSKHTALVSKLLKEPVLSSVSRDDGVSTADKTYVGEKTVEGKKEVKSPAQKEGRTPLRTAIIVVAAALVIVVLLFGLGWVLSSPADSKPPAISGFAVSSVTGSSATIQWVTDEKSTSQVILRDPTGATVTSELDKNLVTKHAVKLAGIKPGVKYHVTVKSADARGNEAVYQTDQTFTLAGQSGALPNISNVSVADIGDTSAVITWQTDRPATSQVMVSQVGTATPFLTEPRLDLTLNHAITVVNLKPGVTYAFTLISKDGAGNQTIYETGKTFTTLATSPVGPEVGKKAPDFTLPMLDGQNLTLSSLRGKVVLITFWQRACPACVRQMPMLQSVFTRVPGDKVVIIGVNVLEDEATVKSFRDRWSLTFPIVLDARGKVTGDYKVSDKPANFLLDGQGIIREIEIGRFDSAQEIESRISSLLK